MDEGPGEVATKSGPIGVILILVGGIALLAIIILGVLWVLR